MSFFQNTKIRAKILSVIIPICLLGAGGVSYVSYQFKKADTAYSDFIAQDTEATTVIFRATTPLVGIGFNAYSFLQKSVQSLDTGSVEAAYKADIETYLKRMEEAKTLNPSIAAKADDYIKRARTIVDHTDRALVTARSGNYDDARKLISDAGTLIAAYRSDIGVWNDANAQDILEKSNALTDITNITIIKSLAALGLIFLAGILTSLFIVARGITQPIESLRARMLSLANGETQTEIPGLVRRDEVGEMAAAVAVFRDNAIERIRLENEAEANRSLSERERIEREKQKAMEAEAINFAVTNLATGLSKLADGDVSYRLAQPFTETLDAVRNDFNNSAEKLQAALNDVAQNARGIESGSSEIRAAADDLAKRTEQQAAAVEQTAAALEEITTTVKDSTRRAQEAGDLVNRAKHGAEQSGEVVRKAVVAMEQIAKSADEISNIIGVIDEIAFQTNLLALNAGVEAARAGDAGKGFAVVAQEVRELAQRSANAAKEIKALITTSNEQVHQGVQLVGDTGKALQTIVTEVQEINRHVLAIVESAHEQSSGLQQINTAVNQMDQDTQKNAAMVEETTAATHSLAREVVSLNQLLAQFKLSDGGYSSQLRAATSRDNPVTSPVRALGRKIASAFSGNAALDTANSQWQDF